ncbi:hypothetical protein [Zhihengliuella sp.]|uniref:hypothetical protein n=1 Tax=Zhihengliuella sp. TaxID=1954483 RepID=UPI002810EF7C|nr:hypothetical protein [Zhihengliuella sp.]
MRILSAAVAIVLGAVALLVGIGQKTFWAPSETLTASVSGLPDAPLTVIEPAVADVHDEPVEITIESPAEFNVMLGRSGDVDAWAEGAAVNRVTGIDAENFTVQTEHVEGEASVPSPAQSDLWVATDKVDQQTTHTWTEPAEGDWSLLLAVDGEQPAPVDITFEWPNDAGTPFALALIIIGALLLLLGLIRLIMPGGKPGEKAGEETTANGGTNGGKPTSGVARRVVAAVTAVGLGFGGASAAHASPSGEASESAASESASATPSESAPESAPADGESDAESAEEDRYPVVLETQLERILTDASETIAAGDEAQDVEALRPRMDGTALALRALNYQQRQDGLEVDPAEPVAAGPILSAAVTTDTAWPRTAVAVTQVEGSDFPRVLTLEQASPRENYKLVNNVPMLPGTSFPGIAVGDPAVQPLDPADENGLLASPEAALNGLSQFLSDPAAAEKDLFAESVFIQRVHEAQEAVRDNEDNREFARVNFERAVDVSETNVLATPDGGAIVTAAIDSRMLTMPAEEGGTVSLVDELHIEMAGDDETTGTATFSYTDTVALYIPASGSKDKIQVIAGDTTLKSVTIDE